MLASLLLLTKLQVTSGVLPGREEIFRQLDAAGYSAIQTGEFVEVTTTYPDAPTAKPASPTYGFLVSHEGAKFTVVTPKFELLREKSKEAPYPSRTIMRSYRPADF